MLVHCTRTNLPLNNTMPALTLMILPTSAVVNNIAGTAIVGAREGTTDGGTAVGKSLCCSTVVGKSNAEVSIGGVGDGVALGSAVSTFDGTTVSGRLGESDFKRDANGGSVGTVLAVGTAVGLTLGAGIGCTDGCLVWRADGACDSF